MSTTKMIEKLEEIRMALPQSSYVYLWDLKQILSADDSQQKIEELERRVAELIDKYNDYMHDGDCKEYMVKKNAPAVELCNCTSFIKGKCPVCDKSLIEKKDFPTPSEPSKDDGQTPREAALEVAELLWSIGWESPNDAQTKRLEKALGEIKTILVRSHDQKNKVAISREDAEKWLDSYIHGEERRFNDYSFAATIRQALEKK